MSQLGADYWVIKQFPHVGYFLDVGCADGIKISNTWKLEQQGWKGICIDAFPKNFTNRPNTILVEAVVYSEPNKEVEFIVPNFDPDFGGIITELGQHKDKVKNDAKKIVKLKTVLLADILKEHNAPAFIEYLNLDIEGSEYEVLRTFPFNEYKFGCMTIEHNFEEPKRSQIESLLKSNGYKRCAQVHWDDWYIRE